MALVKKFVAAATALAFAASLGCLALFAQAALRYLGEAQRRIRDSNLAAKCNVSLHEVARR